MRLEIECTMLRPTSWASVLHLIKALFEDFAVLCASLDIEPDLAGKVAYTLACVSRLSSQQMPWQILSEQMQGLVDVACSDAMWCSKRSSEVSCYI